MAAQSIVSTYWGVADVLADHQRVGYGITNTSPDICRCGAKTMPDETDEEIGIRRDRAFAIHQTLFLLLNFGIR